MMVMVMMVGTGEKVLPHGLTYPRKSEGRAGQLGEDLVMVHDLLPLATPPIRGWLG